MSSLHNQQRTLLETFGCGNVTDKRWTGSVWQDLSTRKRWDGSAWQDLASIKRWDGSAWQIVWEPTVAGIALRATSTGQQNVNASSCNITIPASTEVDDLIVVVVAINKRPTSGTNSFNDPAGYTKQAENTLASSSFTIGVYTKLAALEDIGATLTIDRSTDAGMADGVWGMHCRVYSGVDTTTPIDATSIFNNNSGASSSVVAASITTVTADAWLVTVHCMPTTAATSFTDWTDPSGMSNEVTVCSTSASTNNTAVASYDEPRPTTGATGTRTATSPQTQRWGAVTLALRPAA